MIPHIIHYCWFGKNPLPDSAKKCIESWKQFFPDYEIKEWNESNFDITCCAYVREAYAAKKWAFVSDYARFWILYHYGGLYFDTDVEVIKDMSNILDRGPFMGCETVRKCAPGLGLGANPGLGLGANPGLGLYKEILEYYQNLHFRLDSMKTVVYYTSNILFQHGWKGEGSIETIGGVYIYPPEYFCPVNYQTGEKNITEKTVSIHHYNASWLTASEKLIIRIEQCKQGCVEYRIRRIISLPLRIVNKFRKQGIKGVVDAIRKRFSKKMRG